jgi:transcriptional regulator with XRE-family HTH domain
MHELRQQRERQGLTLEDVSQRSGIDKASLSRLETGKQPNPTLFTILQYLDAIGVELVWTFQDAGK